MRHPIHAAGRRKGVGSADLRLAKNASPDKPTTSGVTNEDDTTINRKRPSINPKQDIRFLVTHDVGIRDSEKSDVCISCQKINPRFF